MSIKKTKENNSSVVSYNLADDVVEYIKSESSKDDRSASKYVERLIREDMKRAENSKN